MKLTLAIAGIACTLLTGCHHEKQNTHNRITAVRTANPGCEVVRDPNSEVGFFIRRSDGSVQYVEAYFADATGEAVYYRAVEELFPAQQPVPVEGH